MKLINWAILLFAAFAVAWLLINYYWFTFLVAMLMVIIFRAAWGMFNE